MAPLAQHRLGASLPLGLHGQALHPFPTAARVHRRCAASGTAGALIVEWCDRSARESTEQALSIGADTIL